MSDEEREQKRRRRIALIDQARRERQAKPIPGDLVGRTEEELEKLLAGLQAEKEVIRARIIDVTRALDAARTLRSGRDKLAALSPTERDALVAAGTLRMTAAQNQANA